jgi:hypothetical protein
MQMISRLRVPIILALIILLTGTASRPYQQRIGDGEWYFPQSKYSVSGEILTFYQQTSDYLVVFGFPLSEVEDHPVLPGIKVQYFQRARIELDPNAPEGQRVRMASLGVWFFDDYDKNKPGELAGLPYSSAVCRKFGDRGIAVCYSFLTFYDKMNGSIYFGEPISEMMKLQNGRVVQYFERARMEWWPEAAVGQRVKLTDIGKIDYDRNHSLSPVNGIEPSNIGDNEIMQLVVHAFTSRPLVAANSTQSIYVIVLDQAHSPVQGVLVTVTVHLPDGQITNHRLMETNSDGLTRLELPIGNYSPNQMIQVDVSAKIPQGPNAAASTYFRIWW